MRDVLRLFAAASLSLLALAAHADGVVEAVVRRFAQSDFEFLRAQSNAPFLPLAWVTLTGYQEGSFARPDGEDSDVTFRQSTISEGAFAPIPLGKRDALVVGEWLSLTHFDLDNSPQDELDVLSVAVPVGWIRQADPDWQVAAFVAPLGHKTHEDSWYWETLGGVFTRYASSDRTAWIFGMYMDIAPLDNFYTPYLGATFVLNERWTINAVMPWPAVTYAPTRDTVFRLGVVPSGSSWSIEPGETHPRVSLSAWDFGLSLQRRLYRNVWWGFEAGISGLRGLTLAGSRWQSPETQLDSTGYALLTINLRPGQTR